MSASSPLATSPLGASALRSPASLVGSPLTEKQVESFEHTQRATLAADQAYLASFPELPALLAEFTKAVLSEKPADLRAFAREYFARPVDAGPQ